MRRLATSIGSRSAGARRFAPKRNAQPAVAAATGLATAHLLMPEGAGWSIPRLTGVAPEYQVWSGLELAARTASSFLSADIARAEDWPAAKGNPIQFLQITLDRWLREHGGDEIGEIFPLHLSLTADLDPYSYGDRGDGSKLFLTLEPESAGYVVLGPTLRLLEPIHPRLPVTVVHMLIGSINRWVRVYDWRDALERLDRIREWHDMDPDDDGEFEPPDVEGSIPACMRRRQLARATIERICARLHPSAARRLVEQVLELDALAAQSSRPQLSDDAAELLRDCGEPLPALLAAFEKCDAIEGQFDEEAQGMLEVTPEPNAIVCLVGDDSKSIRRAFKSLATCFQVLRLAIRPLAALVPDRE
ncbi:MAG: hypothetical protein K2X35_03500 [Bryobacteraceae bacterium]|nr:hypothetical protein [Bryobacteraceae bacterium]